jgi:hypothetical protein
MVLLGRVLIEGQLYQPAGVLLTVCFDRSQRPVVALQVDELYAGEVGYFSAAIKQVADARVGDTITSRKNSAVEALPGCAILMLTCAPSSVGHAIPDTWHSQQCCSAPGHTRPD